MGRAIFRLLVLGALLLFACSAIADVPDLDKQASAALHEAERLLETGQFPEALCAIDLVLTQYPGSGSEKWAQLRKVEALYHLARYDEGIAIGRELVQRYSSSDSLLAAWAQCDTGINYMGKEDWGSAVTQLQAAELMNQDDLYDRGPSQAARVRLGEIYMHLRSGQTDAQSAGSVLGFSSNNSQSAATSLSMAVAVMAEVGDIKTALSYYDRLVQTYPTQNRAIAAAACDLSWRWIQNVLPRSNKLSAEDVSRIEMLAQTPRRVAPSEAYLVARSEAALGRLYLQAKEPARAVEVLSDLLSTYPSTQYTVEATYRLACARRQSGDAAGALNLFLEIITRYAPCGYVAPSEYAAAGCCIGLGKRAEAGAHLERLLTEPGSVDWQQMARMRLAGLMISDQDYARALTLLSSARTQLAEKVRKAESSVSTFEASEASHLRNQLAGLDRQIERITELASEQSR